MNKPIKLSLSTRLESGNADRPLLYFIEQTEKTDVYHWIEGKRLLRALRKMVDDELTRFDKKKKRRVARRGAKDD